MMKVHKHEFKIKMLSHVSDDEKINILALADNMPEKITKTSKELLRDLLERLIGMYNLAVTNQMEMAEKYQYLSKMMEEVNAEYEKIGVENKQLKNDIKILNNTLAQM